MEDSRCFLCQNPGTLSCEFCNASVACTDIHASLHRDPETGRCFPFRVEFNPISGQSLIATRDILPAEVVLTDQKSPIAAKLDHCISCNEKIGAETECTSCKIPFFCRIECCSDSVHADWECRLFQEHKRKFDFEGDESRIKFYESLMTLRILLLKRWDPVQWTRLDRLKDHEGNRRREKVTWKYFQDHVVNYIRKDLNLEDLFDDENEIHRAVGLIRINGIQTSNYRALYPTMALINNSCVSNSRCIHSERDNIIIKSQRLIKAKEEITIGYNSLFTGTLNRKENFIKTWFFECLCPRCIDPSECGSNLNAILCPSGDGGILLPMDWKCSKCDETITNDLVREWETELKCEIESGEKLSGGITTTNFYETLLTKYSKRFADTHYLFMKMKSTLISLYGNGPGLFYIELAENLIKRKIDLCQEFLDVFGKVDPGMTDWWAMTTFELLQAKTFLLQKTSNAEAIIKEFQCVIKTLETVAIILQEGKPGTYTRTTGTRVLKMIESMREIIRFAEFL